jgi:hypothetical protein
MQLILPILGGERVPDYRRVSMPSNSAIILVFGVMAMFSETIPFKLGFYFCGVFCFAVLIYQMHRTVVESTMGAEGLFWGSSSIRTLSVIVAATWIPFPIWYALSPEGFNIIQNSAAMKISVAFLNVFSKGAFIYYLMRVRGDLEVKEMVLAEATAVNGPDKKRSGPYNVGGEPADELAQINGRLSSVIFEVLQAMGRQADYEPLKEVLETHMITTQEDLLVLTQDYCDKIALPYGFVTACKAKIRQHRTEHNDKWNLCLDKGDNFDTVSVTTSPAPLPPQVANDPRKLKEHHRRTSQNLDRSPTRASEDYPWNDGMSEGGLTNRTPHPHLPESSSKGAPGMSREELQAAIASSQNILLQELRDMKRAQVEEHSRIKNLEEKVEGDLDAVQGMMGGMMTQVMDKIESRLRSQTPRAPTSPKEKNPFSPGDPPATRGDPNQRGDPYSFSGAAAFPPKTVNTSESLLQ